VHKKLLRWSYFFVSKSVDIPIITELLQEKPPSYNINRFRFNRFNDGSKLILGPGI
jgi:hypothetical protein